MGFFIRFVLTAAGLALIALAVGGILLLMHSGPFVARLVERSLSRDLGAQVRVGSVRVRPAARSLIIEELDIAAPERPLRDGPLISCGRVTLVMDVAASMSGEHWMGRAAMDDVVFHVERSLEGMETLRKAAQTIAEPHQGIAIQSIAVSNVRLRFAGSGDLITLDPFEIEAPADGRPLSPAAISGALVRAVIDAVLRDTGLGLLAE